MTREMENGHHEESDDGEAPEMSGDEYAWLQEQLAAAARIAGGEGSGDAEEDDWVDPTGGSLRQLLSACEEGSADAVEQLVQSLPAGADINTPGPDGDTALHLACLFGHMDCVRALLAGGADANAVNLEDGSTALHDAAAGGYLDICKLIVEKAEGAIIRKADEDGDTPLHNAARGNHPEVVKMLLARGADPRVQNGYGNKPVDEAEEADVIELLQAAEAAAVEAEAQ
ncbi:hypothetical protein GPECTOR_82g236 [Gonium pectorale]|uniref:Uncharacterized protein n=1 Tax=Gonium pectorale TaxID=33097 RepID=A0A150G1F4_GONPE|nr:hypothetical protein GPECTOR_82g236 [Gonium pectorale]|eukprot:KXZ43702.1 hypothetical protein GPECTOR_82g236 [Gonium pectorale]